MLNQLNQDWWGDAARRLNDVGVFADEECLLPEFPALESVREDLEKKLSENGYKGGSIDIKKIPLPKNAVTFLIFDQQKYENVLAAENEWEKDYQIRWHKKVKDRVDDWIERLKCLRNTMESWLPNGYHISERPPVRMYEELMQKFNVSPVDAPAFDILQGNERILRVQPIGLWIIGANGRVDLINATTSYILVDRAESFQSPSWHYYSSKDRKSPTPFDKERFISLLSHNEHIH